MSFLPVSEDKEESVATYDTLCTLIERNQPVLLGRDFENLSRVLQLFGSILGSDLINEEVSQHIVRIIKNISGGQHSVFQEACARVAPADLGFFY